MNNAIAPELARANPRTHAIGMVHVVDCFVRDVTSYASDWAPVVAEQLQSGGVYVEGSKRVTVADTVMIGAQNRGDGGAGYGFEASASNEVLFRDVRVERVRHGFIQNWDFGASGLVWLRGAAIDDTLDGTFATPGRSELHHRLATACLYDSVRDTSGFAAYNRQTESSNAGHAGTETVFWNVAGRDGGTRLSSYQFGRGYVIGTRDLLPMVVPDALEEVLGQGRATDPVDWLEGVDHGDLLVPGSLFEDQLARRLGR